MDKPSSASAVSTTALMGHHMPTATAAIMGAPEAASYLNLSSASLAKMRCMGGGPVFIRLGRKIGYQRPIWMIGLRRAGRSTRPTPPRDCRQS